MAANDTAATTVLGGGRADKRSPPTTTAAQSKRDRKRQALADKMAAMFERLQHEQDHTYRDELQKIQLDTNLVQRFDAYDAKALEVIAELSEEHREAQGPVVHSERARSLIDMAGIQFPTFMEDLEDLIENRDFSLTQSKVRLTHRDNNNSYTYPHTN